MSYKEDIERGECVLGIEFGSTRVKAVLIAKDKSPIASGAYDWENRNVEGVWTYTNDDILTALSSSYADLKADVKAQYGLTLKKLKALGVSAMMHGYLAFDKEGSLLTIFKTWRNTITEAESAELTKLFNYPIAQRWSISHLLYEIKHKAPYLDRLEHVSTLASYVHKLLTGRKVIGIGDASGMFPINMETKNYDDEDAALFLEKYGFDVRKLFPKILLAGEEAGRLTKEGALLLDKEGELEAFCPLCPPEGDAGTGMTATNAVLPRSGNVSAGTSAFAMVVLERPLSKAYSALDIVTTPDGNLVAMAHTNNCTGGYDAWISLFNEVLVAMGVEVKKGKLYDVILSEALKGEADCGGLLSYNYISGEPATGLNDGRPMFVRSAESRFNLKNFMRSELFAAVAAMRVGLDILFDKEDVKLDIMNGHGGYFKTKEVGLPLMAAALKTPVRALSTAGEGGAWGIALLADYLSYNDMSLPDYLNNEVFAGAESVTVEPTAEEVEGFNKFYARYLAGLSIEKEAVRTLEV